MVDNEVDLPAGKRKFHKFPKGEVTQETLMNELGLLQLGMFEPLLFYVDVTDPGGGGEELPPTL